MVSYKRNTSGWGETLSWQETLRWKTPELFHSSLEVAFPFSLPGTFVFPALRNKTDTDATSLQGRCAIKPCRLGRWAACKQEQCGSIQPWLSFNLFYLQKEKYKNSLCVVNVCTETNRELHRCRSETQVKLCFHPITWMQNYSEKMATNGWRKFKKNI